MFFETRKTRKHECLYAKVFLGDTSSMGPMTDRHATYWRCHDTTEDEPIIINATTKTA